MGKWEKIKWIHWESKKEEPSKFLSFKWKTALSGVIVIKLRIELCTRGIFCDLTEPSLHIVRKGQTSIVQLSMEGKIVCFCF